VTEEDFARLLVLQHELPGVEFKSPGPRGEKALFHLVVRAALGMANRRDRGLFLEGKTRAHQRRPRTLTDGLGSYISSLWPHKHGPEGRKDILETWVTQG